MARLWLGAMRRLAICLAWTFALLPAVQPLVAAPIAGRPVNPPPGHADVRVPADVTAAHRPFSELLAMVPDTEASRAWLSYGDVAAWHAETGVPRIADFDALAALADADRDAWLYTLGAQTAPPAALGTQYLATGEMRPAFGFDFFDVAQMLEAGQPPGSLAYLSLNVAPDAVSTSLAASGYAATRQTGAMLYSRGKDYAVDLAAETHLAQLGILNRVALIDSEDPGSQLLIARATGPITQSLAANAGEVRSLSDDRTYRTLAAALEHEGLITGTLVGLLVQDGMQPVDLPPAANAEDDVILAQAERYARDPLPPYRLSAFATSRDGDDTFLTVLIAMGTTGDPQESAAILGDRLADYVSVVTGESLGDQWEVMVSGSFESEARLANVILKLRPDSRLSWMELIARRDLYFLVTE